jgi:SagB-type dehydrogenase family enzyme
MTEPGIVLSFPGRGALSRRGPGLRVRARDGELDFTAQPPRIRRALRLLQDGAPEDDVASIAGGRFGDTLAEWYYCLMTLERSGGISYTVRMRGRGIARGIPTSSWFRPDAAWWGGRHPARFSLSRFAYARQEGGHLVLETPLCAGRVEILDPLATRIVAMLVQPARKGEISRRLRGIPASTVRELIWLLGYFGMLTSVDAAGAAREAGDPVLRTWHFADLLFHARSRAGRHAEKFETFRHLGTLEPPPVLKPAMSTETIALRTPRMTEVKARGPAFTRVLEARRSIREYSGSPVTLGQLGEFLYRTARVSQLYRADGKEYLYDFSRRPYPSGGACYELEVYVAVASCRGLRPGLYHYDPLRHRLEVLPADAAVGMLIAEAASPSARSTPQVVITLAARFQRVTWKYNSSTYAPILKNVGVLLQTMYLVATAMRLAPCAIGGGNSDRFAALAGTNYLEETSVGEFLLGSRPPASRGKPLRHFGRRTRS